LIVQKTAKSQSRASVFGMPQQKGPVGVFNFFQALLDPQLQCDAADAGALGAQLAFAQNPLVNFVRRRIVRLKQSPIVFFGKFTGGGDGSRGVGRRGGGIACDGGLSNGQRKSEKSDKDTVHVAKVAPPSGGHNDSYDRRAPARLSNCQQNRLG
jgi:hypothetical protein